MALLFPAAPANKAPWETRSFSYGARLGLRALAILLSFVIVVCFLVAFGGGSAVLRADELPDSTTTNINIIMVAITFGVGLQSRGGLVLIWPSTQGPARFKSANGLVDPRGLGVPAAAAPRRGGRGGGGAADAGDAGHVTEVR